MAMRAQRRRHFGVAAFLALAAMAAVAAVCSGAAGPAANDLPVPQVADLDLRAMMLLMQERRVYEPVTVLEALKGGPELRAELAASLGRTPDRAGRPVLEGLLIDDQPEVRRAAAFALGLLGDQAARPALLQAVRDPDRESGALAIEALGRLGAPVLKVGEQLLGLPEDERWARLLPYLFRFKEEARLPLAEHGLGLSDPELHRWAAYALARDPLPAAAPLLRRLAADSEPLIRAWAARGLGRVGNAADLAALAPLLSDTAGGVVVEALRAGAALHGGDPGNWRLRLLALLSDPRPGVRVAALETAGNWLPDAGLGDALAARAAAPSIPPTPAPPPILERGLAIVALARGRDSRAAAVAAAASKAAEARLRTSAAEAAGLLGDRALLAHLAGDPSPLVREAVVVARLSGASGGSAKPSKTAAVAAAALADADEGVRATAFDWLSGHPVLPFGKLAAALAAALHDESIESPLGAIKALAARGQAEPRERGAAVELLERLGGQASYVLRREAAAALERLGRPAPPLGPSVGGQPGQLAESLGTYREIVQRTRRPRMVEIRTSRGNLRVRLVCPQAPRTCLNFLELAGQHFYDGLRFHRVVPDFVVQAGDPRGDGFGGPGYVLRDEINRLRYRRGVVGMALAGPDTGGSQFFITLSPQPHLDGGFTAFGEVVAGADVLDAIQAGDRIETIVELP